MRARGPHLPVFPVKKCCNGNYTCCQTNGNRKNKDRLGEYRLEIDCDCCQKQAENRITAIFYFLLVVFGVEE
jgi:hypothetical protein